MVILYEAGAHPGEGFEIALVEAFPEEATRITVDLGGGQDDLGNGEGGDFHIGLALLASYREGAMRVRRYSP